MGGYNSGRTKYTTYVNELLRLDIGAFNRNGLVQAAAGSKATVTWAAGDNSIGLEKVAGGVELFYSLTKPDGTKETVRQLTVFQFSPCYLGKPRPWFSCPECGGRVGFLYMHKQRFKCRKCTGLNYRSQGETVEMRMQRNHDKYRAKLDPQATNWCMGEIPDKPKRMRWTTYEKIASKAEAYEQARLAILDVHIAKYLGKTNAFGEELKKLLGE